MDRETFGSMFDLTGRVAIVTGGTRGIGLAIAEGFLLAGARVVVSSRKADACAAAQEHLESLGGDVLGVPAHMGDLNTLQNLVDVTIDQFGRLDIVVNNAANALAQPAGHFTADAYQKSFDVNVHGPVFLTQYALPHLEASGHGAVINMVSAGAFLFSEHLALYSAGKAAMVSFTKSLAGAFAPKNIRVNAIAPGPIDTDMVRANPIEFQQAMGASTLLNRIASADEVVPTALLLASDAGSYITGQVFSVDGGLVPR